MLRGHGPRGQTRCASLLTTGRCSRFPRAQRGQHRVRATQGIRVAPALQQRPSKGRAVGGGGGLGAAQAQRPGGQDNGGPNQHAHWGGGSGSDPGFVSPLHRGRGAQLGPEAISPAKRGGVSEGALCGAPVRRPPWPAERVFCGALARSLPWPAERVFCGRLSGDRNGEALFQRAGREGSKGGGNRGRRGRRCAEEVQANRPNARHEGASLLALAQLVALALVMCPGAQVLSARRSCG